jgi:hypothetical protein
MQAAFAQNPEIGAAFCRHIFMDEKNHWMNLSDLLQPESGVLDHWLERIAVKQYIQAPSIVVQRDVYEHLGGFDRRMTCWGEDWEMWVRIALHYPVWYETEPLALYRTSSTSLTASSVRSGKNIHDFRQAIDIVRDYLPDKQKELAQVALRNYSIYALNTASAFLMANDISAARNQIKEALRCSLSPSTIYSSLRLSIKSIAKQYALLFS